ncbi:MAG: sugar ABC transporter substrate-binding protein [Actinomycetia bacterium]|nr:sugar ABC transporter substrate-binding protein [Actinomycetes bacterium]
MPVKRPSKLAAAALAAAGALALAGCGSTANSAGNGSGNTKSLVYFIFTGYDYPYFAPMAQAVQQAASHYPNLTVRIVSANNSSSQEISDINEAIANGAKGIILNPVSESVTAAAQKAMQQGIPVVTVDRDVSDPAARDVFIGDNDVQLGYLQTQYALQYLAAHNVPKPWHVAVLQGTLGASVSIGRLNGAMNALKPYVDNGSVQIVFNQSANFATNTAESMVSELLAKTPNIQLIVASNDAMALGAILAVQKAGLTPGKNVLIVGADAQPESLTAVKQGTQLDTVTHAPFVEAYWAVEAMDNILQYHVLPKNKNLIIPMVLVTKQNVDQVSAWGTPQEIPPLPYGHSQAYKVQ